MINATFIMEQHLGHATYAQNVRRFVESTPDIRATWAPVTYEQPGGLVERLPLGRLRGTLRGALQVRRGLAQGGDVVFFNTQVPAALGGAAVRRRPYLIATDLTPLQYDQLGALYNHTPDRDGPLAAYKHRVNVALLRGAARLLPWSSWAGRSLIDDYGVDPARVEVLPPGVDLDRWTPRHHRPDGAARILFVGGDLYRKGGEQLLRAFRALPAGSAELHLVTRTPLETQDGVFVYHDMRPNAPELLALYQRSDLFALPTQAEAFGIAAVEAAATGIPILATNVGGLTDIVADGETGFLVAAGDETALAEHLRVLVDNQALRESMGMAARQRAERLFDARRNATRLVECLLEAARVRQVRYAA